MFILVDSLNHAVMDVYYIDDQKLAYSLSSHANEMTS